MSGPERRVEPRVPLVAKVEGAAGGRAFLAVTENISAGGMLIATANPFSVGETIELTFFLPHAQQKIHVRAVVRRVVEGSAMGIQFEGLTPEDTRTLRQFIQEAGS